VPAGNKRARPTVLLVDDDPAIVRVLERALAAGDAYAVETANHARGALEILAGTLVDLVVSDVHMPDVDGFELFRMIRREGRFRDVPFVFLSALADLSAKVEGFRLGVDDYMTKPVQLTEFVARVGTVLRRAGRSRGGQEGRRYSLAGDFTGIAFADLISLLSMGRRTGRLHVVGGRAEGFLAFDGGRLLQVSYGNLEGDDAFFALMAEPMGQFEFSPEDALALVPNVTRTAAGLLIEGAVHIDHGTAGLPSAPSVAAPGAGGADGGIEPAAANAEAVRELQAMLDDAFALGEVKLWTAEALHRFTAAPLPRARVHAHLVTDLRLGVGALCALAGPVSEEQIALALAQAPLAAGLVLEARSGATLEVVLVDERRPGALLGHLRRQPSVVVLAPPRGDLLAMPVVARSELASSLRRLPPRSLVGVGNGSLARSLAQFAELASLPFTCRALPGRLDQPGFDLRQTLREAISLPS
jgi:CheY-like chemotaxis protein